MFQLMIKPFSAPVASLFKYDNFNDTVLAAYAAMENGYQRVAGQAVILGDGTLLNVMSDESIKRAQASAAQAQRSGGLVQNERNAVIDGDFILYIQFGLVQLPPFIYKNEHDRDAAVEEALKTRRLTYVFDEGHDHFYMMLGSGVMLISLTGQEFLEKRREALAAHQKELMRQQSQPSDPKIFLPPGLRR